MVHSVCLAYAEDQNPNCKDMQDYEKTAGMPVPQTFFRQGYEAKCFTISGNGTYITYVPNDAEITNMQKIQFSSSASAIHVLSDSGSALDVLLNTGQSKQIPIKIAIDNGSTLFYARISLVNLPTNVQAWISPSVSDFFVEQLNKNGTANATLFVYVDSGAKSGKYEIPIVATDGTVKDSSGNETQLNHQVIGTVHLTISGHDDVWASVGLPVDHQASLCSKAPGGGMTCSGFVAYEEYPITVYSSNEKQVKLILPDIPSGKYARFIPDNPIARPNGAASTLIIAGFVKPGVPNALFNPVVTVTTISQDGNKAVNYLEIAESQNLTVLHSPQPIDLTGNFGGDGKSGYGTFGAVYDPADYSSTPLQVQLSVLGIDDGGKITAMPSWLSVLIPDSSFSLKPTIPYYSTIEFTSNNATLGTYSVAIDENVGGSSFTRDIDIKIYNPSFSGGSAMLAPSNGPNMTPVGTQVNVIQIIESIVIGMGLAGGSIFGILYLTKKR